MARKKQTYEDMLTKLEDIVNSMENNELPLEEAMKQYEEGIKMCNKLYKILNDSEGKINILINNKEEDFQ